MNILLFHPQKETLDMITFCLESQLGAFVYSGTTFQETIERFLEASSIDLIISAERQDSEKLLKYIQTSGVQPPVIFLNDFAIEGTQTYPDVKLLGRVLRDRLPDGLMEMVLTHFPKAAESAPGRDYCRISTELLVRVVPLRGDIFIRLSNVKFVKLFRTGSIFGRPELEKFLTKKKVSHLYIKNKDCFEFVQKFKVDLAQALLNVQAGDRKAAETVGAVQELLQELVQRLGFTKDVQEMANSNVQLAMKVIGNSPRLSKVLSQAQLMDGKNYISSHSLHLANICCSIASLVRWPSNTTFQKLTMACLFHDFVLTDPEHAKINTKLELDNLGLPATDPTVFAIKNHPLKAADIIKNFHEVPGDVDVVVAQHHERPDGTGYPRGLKALQIAPLSTVIIMAHDLLSAMEAEGANFKLVSYLEKSEEYYQSSAFKRIWKAMLQMAMDKTEEPSEAA